MNSTARNSTATTNASGEFDFESAAALQELLARAKPFTVEKPLISWWVTLSTLALAAFVARFTWIDMPIVVRLVASVLTGLALCRMFILFHDFEHGALLRNSLPGKMVMSVVGTFLLRAPADWRRSHNFHHQNNGKFSTTNIGSFRLMTTEEWAAATPAQRRGYRVIRNPLVIVFGYVTCFLLEGFKKLTNEDRMLAFQSACALALHGSILVALAVFGGWSAALLGLIVPFFISCGIGAFLFYIQHNFEGVAYRREDDWNYAFAALKSSSYAPLGPIGNWITGNIGYHHVHHLNPKIPFYRLPECMAAIPELGSPSTMRMTPASIKRALSLKLWDERTQSMTPFPQEA